MTTFPFFRLQDFSELINELQLTPNSYVDGYDTNTGQWEQHKINTVRRVEFEPRLLYRLRPRLLESLTDCPGMDRELELQPRASAHQQMNLKRPAQPDLGALPSNKHARVISNAVPIVRQIMPLCTW